MLSPMSLSGLRHHSLSKVSRATGHTVSWYSGAGGYMGMLISYFISIAALPLGTAVRKFRYHEGLGGCDSPQELFWMVEHR